ncbi:polyprenyl synthetase family protein [Halanaeroarchaeum sulfurireducens]|uniref:Geranylgeranyl diphosphate synthase n=1 Tax=Halanaeroarchaeum sulfurireducens TaxID=1604004 RepID=A0A0F7PB37_9EURY|nr:polyprenyl synthetase family protein [Halanaeroarchaeum sulfurireducens]AKH97932.1 geranylgeranyl diphosphate synthase [Halanaeroarchaeum sulfurireducens]ALG82326.1 geranylgeranyl diphosphate synthase [Halanaeroarchaeum sulfurireducens]
MTPEAREETVLEAVQRRRELVNDAIDADLPIGDPERLYEASRYLLEAGGKRLRPAILLLTAEALLDVPLLGEDYREFPTLVEGEPPIDLMKAAVSVEVIQSFTLIHDDIMDQDEMRRGVQSVHVEYDPETAILAGDTLYSKAFEIMIAAGAPSARSMDALDTLASTCTRICEGQSLDLEFETRPTVGTDEYLDMVDRKTAVLYAASASIPAILLGADEHTRNALEEYGHAVGKAFQIHDDILDLIVSSDDLGKQRGSDLVEGKQTIVTHHAREQGVDVDGLITGDDPDAVSQEAIDEAVAVLEEAGSIDYGRTLAREYVEEGKEYLQVLPDNDARARLEQVADYLIERGY